MEVIRQRQANEGIPEEIVRFLFQGMRPNTRDSYESAWRSWSGWCKSRDEDSTDCNLISALFFLYDLFKKGLSYNSINVHKSMLSTTFSSNDREDLGKHPFIRLFMKSVFNQRPPKAKLSHTWDPKVVFDYAKSLGPSATLPIRVLAMKATILLALATFLRVSEIASIDFSSVKQSDTRIVFSLSELRKWQRTGSLQSFSLKLLEDDLICPVRTILEYIRRTADVRGNCTSLFISTVSPYKAVTSSTISHWIKEFLSKSGVGPNFSAHSTRSAASSAASRVCVPVDSILRMANWSDASTFTRFYHRDLPDPEFPSMVFTH